MAVSDLARQLYKAAEPLACVAGFEYNECASCGAWGGRSFTDRDEHDADCALYNALLAYRAAAGAAA